MLDQEIDLFVNDIPRLWRNEMLTFDPNSPIISIEAISCRVLLDIMFNLAKSACLFFSSTSAGSIGGPASAPSSSGMAASADVGAAVSGVASEASPAVMVVGITLGPILKLVPSLASTGMSAILRYQELNSLSVRQAGHFLPVADFRYSSKHD
jgi:hypothetical protein